MKLIEIKKVVFEALEIDNTKDLKQIRPDLVKGLDLRTKIAWQKIELAITHESDSRFQQILSQSEEANKQSNQIIQNSLSDWEDFKNKVIAESEAEINGKLSHLSDYRVSTGSNRGDVGNKKTGLTNIVNIRK